MAQSPIEIQKHLGGVDYPASKEELVEHAESKGAPEDVLERLRKLTAQQFESPTDVMSSLGD